MPEYIYGRRPVLEALRANRRKLEQVIITEKVDTRGDIGEILQLADVRSVPVKRVPREIVDDLSKGANHQSVIVRVGAYPYVDVEDIMESSVRRSERPFILLLDLLQDPQNVGTLMRVAEAVGVHGVIIQERRSVGITTSVVSASSGAVEHLMVAQVTNLVNTMKDLKKQGVWMVGLDAAMNINSYDEEDLNRSIGLVLGSEGEGMRRLVRENCDLLVTLPMRGRVASLNVATAGSVALYAAWQARSWQGWVRKA